MVTASHRGETDRALAPAEIRALLGSRRRRRVLYCLFLYANPLALPDVADRVTEWECGASTEGLLGRRLRTYTALSRTHVPLLAAAGVVVYSRDEDMVELGASAAQLRPYLERTAESDLNTDRMATPA